MGEHWRQYGLALLLCLTAGSCRSSNADEGHSSEEGTGSLEVAQVLPEGSAVSPELRTLSRTPTQASEGSGVGSHDAAPIAETTPQAEGEAPSNAWIWPPEGLETLDVERPDREMISGTEFPPIEGLLPRIARAARDQRSHGLLHTRQSVDRKILGVAASEPPGREERVEIHDVIAMPM